MTASDRAAIDTPAANLAQFEVEVATKLVPREEHDWRERELIESVIDARCLGGRLARARGFSTWSSLERSWPPCWCARWRRWELLAHGIDCSPGRHGAGNLAIWRGPPPLQPKSTD